MTPTMTIISSTARTTPELDFFSGSFTGSVGGTVGSSEGSGSLPTHSVMFLAQIGQVVFT